MISDPAFRKGQEIKILSIILLIIFLIIPCSLLFFYSTPSLGVVLFIDFLLLLFGTLPIIYRIGAIIEPRDRRDKKVYRDKHRIYTIVIWYFIGFFVDLGLIFLIHFLRSELV